MVSITRAHATVVLRFYYTNDIFFILLVLVKGKEAQIECLDNIYILYRDRDFSHLAYKSLPQKTIFTPGNANCMLKKCVYLLKCY